MTARLEKSVLEKEQGMRGRKKEEQVAAKKARESLVEETHAAPVDEKAKKTHTNTNGALSQHQEFIQEAEILAKRHRLFQKTLEEVEKLKPENIAKDDGIRFSQKALVDLLTECLFTVEMAEEYNTILADEALQ